MFDIKHETIAGEQFIQSQFQLKTESNNKSSRDVNENNLTIQRICKCNGQQYLKVFNHIV